MKKVFYILLIAVILTGSVSCSSRSSDRSGVLSSADSRSTKLAAVSMNRFKTEIKNENLGKVSDMTGNYGYDAALATDGNNINYIYMYLPGSDMAESVLTDSDGDGKKDDDLTKEASGANYALYTQDASTGSSSANDGTYGKCLQVGNMILIVSGPVSQKNLVAAKAENFMHALGYDFE